MGSQGASSSRNNGVVVVVFDFDRTLIDCDSDRWVVEGLQLDDIFEQLRPNLGWNALMNRMMAELHSQGKQAHDIAECLRKVPMDAHLISALKSAHALGCDLRVASDSNTFFIETILEQHGLREYFSEINTNPGIVDEEGKLKISPYLDSVESPHGCPLCPPNMCKGSIMERIRAEVRTARSFIYVGDGRNDFCPSLKLTNMDHIMPRKNYPAWHLIWKNSHLIQAGVHEWCNGKDQGEILLQLINEVISDDETEEIVTSEYHTVPFGHP